MLHSTWRRNVILAAGLTLSLTLTPVNAQTALKPKNDSQMDMAVHIGKPMLFMLLPYETKAQIAARTGSQKKLYRGTWAAYGKKRADAGVLAGGSALQSPSEARTLRNQSGKVKVSADSYAETSEQIGGYLLLKVKFMDEAQHWAADCPAVQNGGAVEIRLTVPMMASDMQ